MNSSQDIRHLNVDQVYAVLKTDTCGLSTAQCVQRLSVFGSNSIEIADRWRHLRNLSRQLSNFFTLLLFSSALICFFAEKIQPGQNMALLGTVLAGVALFNALFSFLQEYRAEKAMEALRRFLPLQVEVRRNGRNEQHSASDLVPGDLLLLKEGDRVPADARLIEVSALLVNNAPLTGESQPLSLTAQALEVLPGNSDNIAFAGSLILRGSGLAVVFATGLATEFGKLAHLSQTIHRPLSPLQRQTAHMVRVLTAIAVTLGLSFFIFGVVSGRPLWINLVFMMGIIVANVPEGLLPTFTLALAMGGVRMARKNVLVTSLAAVDTLGAVQVICTDKTGTLTCNQLHVERLCAPFDSATLDDARARVALLTLACAAAHVHRTDQHLSGDPLDVAIAEAWNAECATNTPPTVLHHFAFDVEKKRAAGICTINSQTFFVVKGAWEVLRPCLSAVASADLHHSTPLASGDLERAEATMLDLAGRGMRVVAVAWRRLPDDNIQRPEQQALENNLVLAGFIAIADPIHPEVPTAIACCRRAGISVIMVTGDHPDTAVHIALNCGIINDGELDTAVICGDELAELDDAELGRRLKAGLRIFARTSPAQKMKIVLALKAQQQVVAMTGDGVNDAPALKAADIGIAMGKRGTDVARACAHLILLDDNFASIVAGIAEGRTVYSNIRKFTNYVLVSNGPEIIPYLLYILLPVPLALTVIQILSIDLGSDIVPSMALALEPAEPDIMQEPPRGPTARLLSVELIIHSYLFLGLIEALWSLSLFFYVLHQGGWHYGMTLAEDSPLYRSATAITLASILLMQIANLIGRRHAYRSGLDKGLMTNGLLITGIVVQVMLSWALLHFPPLQAILGTAAVPWPVYLMAWLGVPILFSADYIRKRFVVASARHSTINTQFSGLDH